MLFSTGALVGALLLLNSRLKSSPDGSKYAVTSIKFDGMSTNLYRYTRVVNATKLLQKEIYSLELLVEIV